MHCLATEIFITVGMETVEVGMLNEVLNLFPLMNSLFGVGARVSLLVCKYCTLQYGYVVMRQRLLMCQAKN